MTKWILLIALALGGVVLWKFGPMLMGDSPPAESTAAKSGDPFLTHVPSDTVFYAGGHYDEAILRALAGFYQYPLSPTQMAQFKTLLATPGEPQPALAFFKSLVQQLSQAHPAGGVDALFEVGVAQNGYSAFYAHGAVPVFRISVADSQKLMATVDAAVADSGWQYTTQTLGQATVHTWPLTKPDAPMELQLALALETGSATLTLFSTEDDNSVRQARVAQSPITDSMEASQQLSDIRSQYQFDDATLTLVNFLELATGLLEPDANRLGKDLARYLPEDAKGQWRSELSDACKTEYKAMVATAPRFMSGTTQMATTDKGVSMEGRMIWEMTDASIKPDLAKFRGHIPSHATDSASAIVSFGLGLNTNELVPALTALWTRFVQAPYTCESLVALQEKAKETNPAMLQMFLGMAQGVKGVGFSIFDFSLNAISQQPERMEMLLSVAAESPATLAAMTAMLPMPELNNIVIPADGTPVEVSPPMMPGQSFKVAIKGKHLVVYTGATAEPLANALATEDLTLNGLLGMGLNYRKMGDFFDVMSMGAAMGGQSCLETEEMRHTMGSLNMDMTLLTDVSDDGLDSTFSGTFDQPLLQRFTAGGSYQVEVMNEMCVWENAGVEVWGPEGKGSVTETYLGSDCVNYEMQFDWRQAGNEVIFTNSESRSRDTCDAAWEKDSSTEPYACTLMNIEEDSFQCLFDAGTEDAVIYRYKIAS